MTFPAVRPAVIALSACALLSSAGASSGAIVVTAAGGGPLVRVYDNTGANLIDSFLPYGESFRGGIRVASGDVNGDGVADIVTGAGPGSGPHVKVFSGADHRPLHDFLAYDANFTGGVNVAAADLNGDGRADVITGAGPGSGPHVKVFNGATGENHASFFAGSPNFTGGVNIAASTSATGFRQIIFGNGPGGLPIVGEYSPTGQPLGTAFAFDSSFTGGVRVATGDFNGDGFDDIVAAQATGGAGIVQIINGANGVPLRNFFAYGPGFNGGVSVAVGDVTGDGVADIITGSIPTLIPRGSAPASHVKVFSGVDLNEAESFFLTDSEFGGGVEVAFSKIPAPGPAGAALVAGLIAVSRRRRA